jgi:hypothetical protein
MYSTESVLGQIGFWEITKKNTFHEFNTEVIRKMYDGRSAQ